MHGNISTLSYKRKLIRRLNQSIISTFTTYSIEIDISKKIRSNMKNAKFLLLILMFFNLGYFKKSFGKFMLVELDQKKDAIAKSGAGNIYWTLNILFHFIWRKVCKLICE